MVATVAEAILVEWNIENHMQVVFAALGVYISHHKSVRIRVGRPPA